VVGRTLFLFVTLSKQPASCLLITKIATVYLTVNSVSQISPTLWNYATMSELWIERDVKGSTVA